MEGLSMKNYKSANIRNIAVTGHGPVRPVF